MITELKKLQTLRNSKVIIYACSDRANLPLQIEEDVIEEFHDLLEAMGSQENIDLFIHSRGGSTIVPLPLVRLIRKYCKKFGCVVPFRAHSAATMISIGADEIYMSRKAELGPVDPQLIVNTPQGQRQYASTDIFGYLDFAKKELGWKTGKPDSAVELIEFFHKYCALSPDFLGKIYRMFTQSKKYIKELATSHINEFKISEKKIENLAETLIRGFGSHDYKIDSHEARDRLGLNVLPYHEETEKQVDALYKKIVSHLKLKTPFVPKHQTLAPNTAPPILTEVVGIIASENKSLEKKFNYVTLSGASGSTIVDGKFSEWL